MVDVPGDPLTSQLIELKIFIPALPVTAGLLAQPGPGEVAHLLQQVIVPLQLLETPAGRVLGEGPGADPVEVTANSPGDELHHALSEAEPLILHTGSGRGVEDPPLDQLELSLQ